MYQLGSDPVPAQPVDEGAPDGSTADSPAVATAGPATIANVPSRPFVTELAHAMQAAAEHQREATNAELEAVTSAHLERVRARAAAEAEELRRMARQDIDAIKAWQEAEAERIRAEAAQRIVVRGEELDGHLIRHAALVDTEVGQIEGVVADYQLKLSDYFDRLTTEPNPGVIARLADQLPEPPDLVKVGGDARAEALAAVAAERDVVNPEAQGPDLVPVMDPAAMTPADPVDASAGGETDGGASDANGTVPSNGDGQERISPAIRLLRSIATFGAPATEAHASGTTTAATNGSSNDVSNGATNGTSADNLGAEAAGEVAPKAVEAAEAGSE
jgi:F0F1-type ATP synthase membrane subunit b/b'